MSVDVEKVVVSEFTSYFNGDEEEWTPEVLETALDELADESAQRLCVEVGVVQRPALVALLRDLRDHRLHPLHRRIATRSQVSWTSTDEQFAYFYRLVDAITARIESAK